MPENKIALNWDGDAEFFFLKYSGVFDDPENIKEKAKAYIDRYYRDRGIGDIFFNIFAQTSVTPSRVFTDRVTKLHQKEENGTKVDYSGLEYLALPAECREKYGVGLTETWIDHCREAGIRPWISFRMNDNHFRDEKTCFLRGDFFYEALENGWILGDGYRSGYRNWDYAAKPVQDKMIAYISEQLGALDVFGIELDFMREPKCLKYLSPGDHCGVINGFMERAKDAVKKQEKIRKHPIKIAVRVPRDPMLSKRIGFDALYWAKNSLADVVIPSSHWICNDTGMPIADWVKMLSPYGAEVWACMEMNLPGRLTVDLEAAKAHTAQYAAQGSAKTYIFNLYHPYFERHWANDGSVWVRPPRAEETLKIWETAGDPEKCRRGVRRHIVTEEIFGFQEIKPRWAPLPMKIGEGKILEVQTGPIEKGDEVTVYFVSTGASSNDLNVSLDGEKCVPVKNTDADIIRAGTDEKTVLAYRAPDAKRDGAARVLWITGKAEAEITYAEIKIDAH
ncbi:MAG: hypothetical protein IJV00_04575 [Clostridia bacterium]|nr:hypothetical protein [Clostridia bacterium]